MREVKKERKVRVDKKRNVRPIVSMELYDIVSRLSYITQRPMKDVSEQLCEKGIFDSNVIERMSPKFRRDFFLGMTCYKGNLNQSPYRVDRGSGERGRLDLRLASDLYEKVSELAYALNMTLSSATTFLLESALTEESLVIDYIETYVKKSLDPNRYKQLQQVITYINRYQDKDNKVTLTEVVQHVMGEIDNRTQPVKQALYRWLDGFFE